MNNISTKKQLILALTLSLLTASLTGNTQNKVSITPTVESLFSSGESLPFWLTHNQHGKYQLDNNPSQLIQLKADYERDKLFNTSLRVKLGTDFIATYSSDFETQFNQLFAKVYLKGWKLEAGWFHEPSYFDGLSSTNGNMDRSNNARPYPKIRLATDDFIPFLFWKNWFSFNAEYDEGLLNDERTVSRAHLHHKSLYLKAKLSKNTNLSIGINHYVMWGGFSSDTTYGQLPEGFKNYFTYITGSIGSGNFPMTDQLNVAGNQFGTYRIQYDVSFDDATLNFYINHPFEDHGGMELQNLQDNLYGVFIGFGQNKILESILYEMMFTKFQSGHIHVIGVQTGRDNYYTHSVYRSGYTYEGYTMASPLFGPINNSLNRIIENTRIVMHHLGAKGSINENLKWDTKLTFSKNWGTYDYPYEPVKKQFSTYLHFNYNKKQWPVNLALSLAADFGTLYPNNAGAMFSVSKTF